MVTTRLGPKVAKERFDTLDEALAALERHASASAGAEPAPHREVLGRVYAPGRQVAGRFELRGPGVRGGIDLRGDGSAEAFTGRIFKKAVERHDSETAVAALARALSE